MKQERVLIIEENFSIRLHHQQDTDYHSHNFFELVYIIGGSTVHTMDSGGTRRVSAGDYFIIDYGTSHRYQNSQNCTLINCLFLPELIHDTLAGCHSFDEILRFCLMRYYRRFFSETPANRIFHDDDGRIRDILENSRMEYEQKQLGYEEILQYGIMEIVICTMRRLAAEDKLSVQEKAYSQTVESALAYLSLHYKKKGILTEFCERNHYSVPYVSRCFKEETGYTFQKYIQKIRIEKSCELLLGTDMPIQQIAYEVGYEDTKFYHQLFRRMLHMSPREYRTTILPK